MVTFHSLRSGSVIVGGNVGIDSSSSSNTIYNNAQKINNNLAIGPFNLVSSSISPSGFKVS